MNASAYPPSPFDPPDPSVPRRTRSLKPWLFVGGGAVVLFFLLAGILLVANQNALLAWTLTTLEQRIEGRLGADLAPEARARLKAAFETARGAVESGKYNLLGLELAQTKLLSASSSGDPLLSATQVTALAEALEAVPIEKPAAEPPGE